MKSLWIWSVVALVAIVAAVLGATRFGGQEPEGPKLGKTAKVVRGPLRVTVIERGAIKAADRETISNELRWSAVIKSIVPDGTYLEPNQVYLEFECQELLDALTDAERAVKSAKLDHYQATKNLELKRKEMANKVSKAKASLDEAKANEKRYIAADGPNRLRDAQAQINLAEADLKIAEARLEFKQRVNKDPELNSPYSQNEIDADKLKVERLRLAWEKAKANYELLKKYDDPLQRRKLKTAIVDAGLELDRAELEKETQLAIAERNVEDKLARLEERRQKLKELREDEETLVREAKHRGLVVYDTARRHWQTPLEVKEGQEIPRRQQIMIIPDLETLQVEIQVYESVVEQIDVGMPAIIRLDARPGVTLAGKVADKGVLPSRQHWWNPNVKVFDVSVDFVADAELEGLKPNMTAEVELVLAELTDVLQAPVAAVFTEQETTFCWRVTGGKAVRTDIELGRMNDKQVEVLSGLAAGDRVLLAPPPGNEDAAETAEEPEEVPEPPTPSAEPAGSGE